MIDCYDPYAPEAIQNPYPAYAWLREHDPVHWGAAGDEQRLGTWYLTRYADALPVLKDPRFGREVDKVMPPEAMPALPAAFNPLLEMAEHWMILRDPPMHTQLRGLIHRHFTPNAIEQKRPRLRAIADAIAAELDPRGFDLLHQYAAPLPIVVVAEFVGVPAEDRDLLLPWSIDLATAIDLRQNAQVRERATQSVLALAAYLRDIIAARRRQPTDDIISHLVALEREGGLPHPDALLGTLIMLLFAGFEPSMHMIGNGVLALLNNPAQLALLRAQPDLLEPALDELIRYDSSVQMTFRYALEDAIIGEQTIHAGDHVAIVFGALNRDPAQWAAPDTLDLRRVNNRSPFGLGVHFCLGVSLARLEGQEALAGLLARFPQLSQVAQQLSWQETAAVRGLKTLKLQGEVS